MYQILLLNIQCFVSLLLIDIIAYIKIAIESICKCISNVEIKLEKVNPIPPADEARTNPRDEQLAQEPVRIPKLPAENNDLLKPNLKNLNVKTFILITTPSKIEIIVLVVNLARASTGK